MGDPRPLGREGHMVSLTYDFVMPGGCDTLSALLQVPPSYRSAALSPGRIIRCYRGASCMWSGKLMEATPSKDGWTITATGDGVLGTDYAAYFPSAYNLNDPINYAISRGLRWYNPSPGITTGWVVQAPDNASETITDHMTAITSKLNMTWYVNRPQGASLAGQVNTFQVPSTTNRLLVCTDPVPRNVFAELTTIWVNYMQSDDNAGNQVTALTSWSLNGIQDPIDDIDVHGPNELYIDITGAGVMSLALAQQMAADLLHKYGRAAWGGSFTARQGQLLNLGGAPIDIATDQAGTVARLLVTDAPYGGEVELGAIEFAVGKYGYDDGAQLATLTPFQSSLTDLQTLLSSSVAWE